MLLDIRKVFESLSISDMLKCREILKETIEEALVKDKKYISTIKASDYVDYHEEFLQSSPDMHAGLLEDIEKMGLDKLKKSDSGAVNMWLSTLNSSYTWVSKKNNKLYQNKPHPITNYANIENLRNMINDKLGSNLNSCLVTFYPTGQSGINLHTDNEEVMDNRQPICVASFGAVRTVEFLRKYQGPNSRPQHVIQPKEGSIYCMLPQCQEVLRHRVKPDNNVKSWRVCMSFRRMHPENELNTDKICVQIEDINYKLNSSKTADKLYDELPEFSGKERSPVKQAIEKYEEITLGEVSDDKVSDDKSDNKKETVQLVDGIGDVPASSDNIEDFRSLEKRSTTVIFGTSITKHLSEKRLGGRRQHCINVSKSGAKIHDISDMVDSFVHSNPYAGDVKKIIFNFGTNDIMYEKFSINKYKEPVINLINKTKRLFPYAAIFIVSVLPMRNCYKYTANNFLRFNEILLEVSNICNCTFVDCFWDFLTSDMYDINRNLFCWDGVHLNGEGLNFLGQWFYYLIHMEYHNNKISFLPCW